MPVKAGPDRPVILGRVRGIFGTRGALRVQSYTDPAERILDYAHWHLNGAHGRFLMVPLEGRWHGPGLVVRLGFADGGELADRDSAQAFIDSDISVPRSALPPLPEGEVYWVDLIGCTVQAADGRTLGRVAQVLDMPAHPVLQLDDGQTLIPFVRGPIISAVDLASGRITTQWLGDAAAPADDAD